MSSKRVIGLLALLPTLFVGGAVSSRENVEQRRRLATGLPGGCHRGVTPELEKWSRDWIRTSDPRAPNIVSTPTPANSLDRESTNK